MLAHLFWNLKIIKGGGDVIRQISPVFLPSYDMNLICRLHPSTITHLTAEGTPLCRQQTLSRFGTAGGTSFREGRHPSAPAGRSPTCSCKRQREPRGRDKRYPASNAKCTAAAAAAMAGKAGALVVAGSEHDTCCIKSTSEGKYRGGAHLFSKTLDP